MTMPKLPEHDRKALNTALGEICYAGCRIEKHLKAYAENDLYLKELIDQLTMRPIVAMIKMKDYLGLRHEDEQHGAGDSMHESQVLQQDRGVESDDQI
jgi:hypothetical protein